MEHDSACAVVANIKDEGVCSWHVIVEARLVVAKDNL